MVTLAEKRDVSRAIAYYYNADGDGGATTNARVPLQSLLDFTADAHSTGHVGVSSKIEIGYFCRYTGSVGRLMTCGGKARRGLETRQ